jgi:hypothetical protein
VKKDYKESDEEDETLDELSKKSKSPAKSNGRKNRPKRQVKGESESDLDCGNSSDEEKESEENVMVDDVKSADMPGAAVKEEADESASNMCPFCSKKFLSSYGLKYHLGELYTLAKFE